MSPGHNYIGHNYIGHKYEGHNYVGHNYVGHNYVGHNYVGRNFIGHNYVGHNYIGHNYIVHNYVGHNYIGHNYVGHNYVGHNYIGHNYVGHNYIGHDYIGHNYIGHDYIGHNYIGHNYIGHNYVGHDYVGHNYIGHNCIGARTPFFLNVESKQFCELVYIQTVQPKSSSSCAQAGDLILTLVHPLMHTHNIENGAIFISSGYIDGTSDPVADLIDEKVLVLDNKVDLVRSGLSEHPPSERFKQGSKVEDVDLEASLFVIPNLLPLQPIARDNSDGTKYEPNLCPDQDGQRSESFRYSNNSHPIFDAMSHYSIREGREMFVGKCRLQEFEPQLCVETVETQYFSADSLFNPQQFCHTSSSTEPKYVSRFSLNIPLTNKFKIAQKIKKPCGLWIWPNACVLS